MLDDNALELTPASADASFRSYWRTNHAGQSWIVMDSPPAQEDPRPWLEIGARLAAAGLHVPAVRAHAGRLGQVVLNLLVNAAQAPAGATPAAPHVVRVRTAAEPGQVLIDVDDSGAGVPAELEQRIFEPFFSTKASSRGSGLGLSISRSLVESFGGTIELARSDLGGARFRIRLPTAA